MDGGLMSGVATKAGDARDRIDSSIHGSASGKSKAIFWFAVLIQIVDVFLLRFDRTVYLATSVALYMILAIWAAVVFHERGEFISLKNLFLFILISAFYIVVPFFLYWIPKIAMFGGLSAYDWVVFFLSILPIWPIFIGLKEEIPFVHTYVNAWVIILIFLFIMGFALDLSISFCSQEQS
jgi:hypothetical protein